MKAISYQLKSFNGFNYTFKTNQLEASLSTMSYDCKTKNTGKNRKVNSVLRGNVVEDYKIIIYSLKIINRIN